MARARDSTGLVLDSDITIDGTLNIGHPSGPGPRGGPGNQAFTIKVQGELSVGSGFHKSGGMPRFAERIQDVCKDGPDGACRLYDAQGALAGEIAVKVKPQENEDARIVLAWTKITPHDAPVLKALNGKKRTVEEYDLAQAKIAGAVLVLDPETKAKLYRISASRYFDGTDHQSLSFQPCTEAWDCDLESIPATTREELERFQDVLNLDLGTFCATPQDFGPPTIAAGTPIRLKEYSHNDWEHGVIIKYECRKPLIKQRQSWHHGYGDYFWDGRDGFAIEITDGFDELFKVGSFRLNFVTPSSSEGFVQPSTLQVKHAVEPSGPPAFPLAVSRLGSDAGLDVAQQAVDSAGRPVDRAAAAVVATVEFKDPQEHAHKMYSIAMGGDTDWNATQLYFKTSDLCGTAAFSQPALQCGAVKRSDILAAVPDQVPQRAFGVELELLARKPSDDLRRHFSKKMVQELIRYGEDWNGTVLDQMSPKQQKSVRSEYKGLTDSQRERLMSRLDGMKGVEACYRQAKRGKDDEACGSHDDCGLTHFCAGSSGQGACRPRTECVDAAGSTPTAAETPIDGVCPMLLSKWSWTYDSSVQPMRELEARELLGPDASDEAVQGETSGIAFELVSAPPPHALAGRRGVVHTAEVLGVMSYMGVQTGPKLGMHVHVNVGKPGVTTDSPQVAEMGRDLSIAEISNIWAQYARFQPIITEMLQDNRVGNHYCKGLLFQKVISSSPYADKPVDLETEANGFQGLMLRRMFEFLRRDAATRDDTKYCNYVLTGEESSYGPCQSRWPKERYYQLNLAVLNKYGTMEFRGFPATHDSERALAWVNFVLAFADHYSTVRAEEGDFFAEATPEAALKKLMKAQVAASFEQLEGELGISLDYFKRRPWVTGYSCSARVKVSETRKKDYKDHSGEDFTPEDSPEVRLEAATGEPDSPRSGSAASAVETGVEVEQANVRRHRAEARPDGQLQF